MLMRTRDVDDFVDLRHGNLARIGAANAHALAMNLQHDLRGLLAAHGKDSLQDDDAEVHRCVIVVQQHHFIQRRRLYLGLLGLEYDAVLLLVAHCLPRYSGWTWGPCLMIVTVFSRGTAGTRPSA